MRRSSSLTLWSSARRRWTTTASTSSWQGCQVCMGVGGLPSSSHAAKRERCSADGAVGLYVVVGALLASTYQLACMPYIDVEQHHPVLDALCVWSGKTYVSDGECLRCSNSSPVSAALWPFWWCCRRLQAASLWSGAGPSAPGGLCAAAEEHLRGVRRQARSVSIFPAWPVLLCILLQMSISG